MITGKIKKNKHNVYVQLITVPFLSAVTLFDRF